MEFKTFIFACIKRIKPEYIIKYTAIGVATAFTSLLIDLSRGADLFVEEPPITTAPVLSRVEESTEIKE